MKSRAMLFSIAMHVGILILMFIDFGFLQLPADKPAPVPLITVDLTKVQIANKTNLPPQIKTKTKTAVKTPAATPKSTAVKTTQKKVPQPVVKPIPQKELPNSAKTVEMPIKSDKKSKIDKNEPKKNVVRSDKTKSAPRSDLKSLLASVEKIKKSIVTAPDESEAADSQNVTDGIDGGTEGSLTQMLTISERDLIAVKMRACWNVDAGKVGIENMIVDIKTTVGKDGRVQSVSIVNMKSDAGFKAVAESARRAVYICDNKADSPFKILAEKYADHYASWKEIRFRFNPIDGGIF